MTLPGEFPGRRPGPDNGTGSPDLAGVSFRSLRRPT